ncbi:MAG: transcriptional activator RfaH [Hyphomicrobiaceae bacterium]
MNVKSAIVSGDVENLSCNEAGQWLAIATHPHKERAAIENLERQDFQTYCPMVRKRIRHARRVQDVLRPLFPGYVFAALSAGQSWRSIHSTLGVRRVIAFGETPGMLSGDFISALRAREIDGAIVKPSQDYQVGQTVRMTGAAFEGLVATIVEMDEKQRLVVLLDLLNQTVRVHTDVHGIRET